MSVRTLFVVLLTLSLRNPEDKSAAKTSPAILAGIRFRQEKPEVPAEVAPAKQAAKPERRQDTYDIVTLRGSQRGRVSITQSRSSSRVTP